VRRDNKYETLDDVEDGDVLSQVRMALSHGYNHIMDAVTGGFGVRYNNALGLYFTDPTAQPYFTHILYRVDVGSTIIPVLEPNFVVLAKLGPEGTYLDSRSNTPASVELGRAVEKTLEAHGIELSLEQFYQNWNAHRPVVGTPTPPRYSATLFGAFEATHEALFSIDLAMNPKLRD
jgi:hypothetical protein